MCSVDTHPYKKGPVMENCTRHLTSFSIVIYQAKRDLWCPVNVGWENFSLEPIFEVKLGKNGLKWLKNGYKIFSGLIYDK